MEEEYIYRIKKSLNLSTLNGSPTCTINNADLVALLENYNTFYSFYKNR